MAERASLRATVRQLAEGLLHVAELTAIAAAGCLLGAALFAWLVGRAYGPTAVLVCGFVGVGMMFAGTWQNMPMGPLARRRRRAADERHREQVRGHSGGADRLRSASTCLGPHAGPGALHRARPRAQSATAPRSTPPDPGRAPPPPPRRAPPPRGAPALLLRAGLVDPPGAR